MEKEDRIRALSGIVLESGTIREVQFVAAGAFVLPGGGREEGLPPFFRVKIHSEPAPGSNINTEVWLPETDWNGRLLGTGNGGGAGSIWHPVLANGVRQGFAAANTDMGTSPDANCAAGFPERWADFGYRATHVMTVAAKEIIRKFYGRPADRAYFMGSSTGGQQGLMEAQRFPSDYDGIVAGVPANNRTLLHTAFLWNYRALRESPGSLLKREDIERITQKTVSLRSREDGGHAGDAFFTDPGSCAFGLGELLKGLPLNGEQRKALEKIYAGPTNPRTGEQIYTPIPIGSESSPYGLLYQEDSEQCPDGLFYPFKWAFGDDFDCFAFDFDHDLDALNRKLAPLLNANSPDLDAIRQNGGKLLLYSGTADPLVPYPDALNYYERVVEAQHGLQKTQDFFRYFLIPGRCHGSTLSFDIGDNAFLSALMEWVEKGKAPDRMIAEARRGGSPAGEILAQRPVYAYPKFAEYAGGDPNLPSSYRDCVHRGGRIRRPAERYLTAGTASPSH